MAPAASPDLIAFLPSFAGGGAERVVLQLLGDFTQLGVRCEVAVAAPGGALATAVPPGVTSVSLSNGKAWRAIPALRRHLATRRPGTLLTSILSANLAGLLALCGLRGRPRCVVREASMLRHDTHGRAPAQWVNRLAVRGLYPRADAVIALSEAMVADLQHFGVPRRLIAVIPNPPLAFAHDTAPAPRPRPYLLACGRLELQKDHATLLRAFARLGDRPLDLVILGEGSQRDVLAEFARTLGVAARVHLAGFVAEPQAWYRHAAALVHTSRWEGFPNVIVEALTRRVPVIATRCNDTIDQLLDGGRLGAVVPVGDDAAVARAIEAVLDGTAPRADAGAHLAQFDRGAIARRYLEVLFPSGAGVP